MKIELKVVLISAAFALLGWVFDAVVVRVFFTDLSFWDELIFAVPSREIYGRVAMAVCFLAFGVVLSFVLGRYVRTKEILRDTARGVSGATGEAFFRSVVQYLAKALEADYAFIGELTGEDKKSIRTIAVQAHGKIVENFEYELAHTPCANVVEHRLCCYPRDVQQRFPLDHLLVDMGIESYIGTPLFDSAGKAVGLIVVLDGKPLEETKLAKSTLQIFAARTAAELERRQAEEEIRKLNAELERRVQERTGELEESQKLFENLATVSPVGIFRADTEGNCLYVNERWSKMAGLTLEEAKGKGWVQSLHPEDRDRVLDKWQRATKEGSWFRSEFRFRRPDGVETWVFAQAVAEKDKEGEVVAYVGTTTDINERKNLEEQLRQAQKMEAVGQLAGGVAHDFNNLLTVISGYSELWLNDLEANDPRRSDVEEIRKAADRATSLTQQLLAFSRRQVLQPEILDLNLVLTETEKMLRRLIGEDIELETRRAPGLGQVKADPGQIEQVILNLAVNARDAMPRGGKLTLETANVDLEGRRYVGTQPGLPQGCYVMLAVSDTGTGMTPDIRSHIFEPFFTTKEKGKGTGLGLSTVYGVVKQSGGYIWVDTELNRGTTFKIYLPRVMEREDSPRPVVTHESRPSGTETILLVEDEDSVRKLTRTLLEVSGYRVLEAQDGTEALRRSEGHSGPIDLLVTDVVMPGMSGRELAQRLIGLRPDTKVLYISGYTDDAIVHHGVLDDDMHFLQKPFTLEALAGKLRAVMESPPRALPGR